MAPTTDPPQGKPQSAPGPISKEPSTGMNGHNGSRQPIPGNAPRNGKTPLVPRRRDARPPPSMRQFSRPAVTANAVHGSPFDEDVLPATYSQSRTWVKPKVDSGGGDNIPTGPSRPVVPQTAHSRTAPRVAPWTHTTGDLGKNNATSVTPSRPSAASPVASRAESALTKRHEPHIFLSSDRVPVKDYIHGRLKAHYKTFGCQDVHRGPVGFYITFPDTSEGRAQLVKCAQKTKNDALLGQYSLKGRVFYNNKEVADLQRLKNPTTAKRSRSSSPDISIVCAAAKSPVTTNTQRGRGISSDALAQSLTPRPHPTSPGILIHGRAAKPPTTTSTQRDPDISSNALAQSFAARPRPSPPGTSILGRAAKSPTTTTTKTQQESDSSSDPPVQSFTPRPLSSSSAASPRPGHEQTSSGPKVAQSIVNGVEKEDPRNKVLHTVATEAGEEEANTKVLQGVVAEVGVEASRTNIPSLVKHIPKHPLDDSSSMASGTSASSRSKTAKCRVCKGLGGTLSVCPTCSRHYHKHCRPSGCRAETADMHWQCESCVKRGIPSARKSTSSVTAVTGTASAATGEDRAVVNSWPSEERPAGEEALGTKVTRARGKSKAEDKAKVETTNAKGDTAVNVMLKSLQKNPEARVEARPEAACAQKNQLKRKADADAEGDGDCPIKKARINDLGVGGVVDSTKAADQAPASLRMESQSAITVPKHRAAPLQDRPSSSHDAEQDLLSEAQNLVDQSFAATEAVTDESAGTKKPSFQRVRRANTSVDGSRGKQTQQSSETHNPAQGVPAGHANLHSLSASNSGTSKAAQSLDDGKTAHQPSDDFIAKPPQRPTHASLAEKVPLPNNTIQPPATRSGRNKAQRTRIRSMLCSSCGKKNVPYHISGKAKCSACKSKPDVLPTPAQMSGLQEDAISSAQALVESQDVTRHDSARGSEGETCELWGPEGNLKAEESVKPLDRSAKETPVETSTTSSSIESTMPHNIGSSDQQPCAGVTAEADNNAPAIEQSDRESELTELTDGSSSPGLGSGATSEIDLGDSLDRPPGTYTRLISMALLDIPDNWGTPAHIAKWVADNIPGYRLGVGRWASSLHSILNLNAKAKGNTRIVRSLPIPGQIGPLHRQKKAYALLPGVEDKLLRWDATLQRPVRASNGPVKQRKTVVAALAEATIPNAEGSPQQTTQRHAKADAEEDAAMLDQSDEPVPARVGYTVSSTKARQNTEEDVPKDNKTVAGRQYPRASALEGFPASAFASPADESGQNNRDTRTDVESGQDTQDTRTDYERVFGPAAPVLPAAHRWRQEPTETWTPEDEAAMLRMHREDRARRQREKPSMSLFVDRPHLDPEFERRQQAKVEEIALRREKQRAYREERRRQGLPYSKSGSCAAPLSPLGINFSRRPLPRSIDNATIQLDVALDAFFGLRKDVVASLDNATGELLYTTADGKVYRTGSFA